MLYFPEKNTHTIDSMYSTVLCHMKRSPYSSALLVAKCADRGFLTLTDSLNWLLFLFCIHLHERNERISCFYNEAYTFR